MVSRRNQLFLIYANDLCNASNILDPIMFSEDTNLFQYHQNTFLNNLINKLFTIFNEEIKKIGVRLSPVQIIPKSQEN